MSIERLEVIYTKKGHPPVRMLINCDEHPWHEVCNWVHKRLFPNLDLNAPDPVADRIIARLKAKK